MQRSQKARFVPLRNFLFAFLVLLAPSMAPAVDDAKKPDLDDYELYQLFADTIDQVQRNYVKEVSRREIMEAAIQGVLGKLDPYSNYIKPDEINHFKDTVESQFGGIGIQVGMEGGRPRVISPIVGTPAHRAGIEAGDLILEIDGKSTEGLQLVDEAVKLLKGETGTQVTLTVQHAGSRERKTVTLTREVVHVDTVLGDRRKDDGSWDFMLDHDRNVGYIRITSFSRDTTHDLRKALDELKKEGLKGLILDLRFNPGGLLSTAIEVCDLFVPGGRIVSTQGRNSPQRVWDARQEGTYEGFPMAVLVNRYSASASEITSACLQDNGRARVIGERTWGKGSVQNVIDLEGGKSALKLTTASYVRPNGKNIHRFPGAKESDEWGVSPDQGYEMKLSAMETERLSRYRHDRDILQPRQKPAADGSEPAAETTASTETKPAAETQSATDTKPAAEPPKPSDAEAAQPVPAGPTNRPASKEFVDTQLQKAVDFLTQELARAN